MNNIHLQTGGLVIFGGNQLCHFPVPVDGADIIWKRHNLGNLVVGAGRGASKECHCPIHEYGMLCCILATSTILQSVAQRDPTE